MLVTLIVTSQLVTNGYYQTMPVQNTVPPKKVLLDSAAGDSL